MTLFQILRRPQDYFDIFKKSPDVFLLTNSICQNIDSATKSLVGSLGILHLLNTRSLKAFVKSCQTYWSIADFARKVWQAMTPSLDINCPLCAENKGCIPPLPGPDCSGYFFEQAKKTVDYAHTFISHKKYTIAKNLLKVTQALTQHSSILYPQPILYLLIIEALVRFTEEADIPNALFTPDSSEFEKTLASMWIFQEALKQPKFIMALEESPFSCVLGAYVHSEHQDLYETRIKLCPALELLEAFYSPKTFMMLYKAFALPKESDCKALSYLHEPPSHSPDALLQTIMPFFAETYQSQPHLFAFTQDLLQLVEKPYFSHVLVALMEWKRIIQKGTDDDKDFLYTLLENNPYTDPAHTIYSLISYALHYGTQDPKPLSPAFVPLNWSTKTIFPGLRFLATMHSRDSFLNPLRRDVKLLQTMERNTHHEQST